MARPGLLCPAATPPPSLTTAARPSLRTVCTAPQVWHKLRVQLTPEEIREDLGSLRQTGGAAVAAALDSLCGREDAAVGVQLVLQLADSDTEMPQAPLQESWLEPPLAVSHGHPPLAEQRAAIR